MKQPRASMIILAVVAAIALTSTASAEVVLEARAWSPDLSGLIRIDGSTANEIIDLTNDLGLEDDDVLESRLVIRPSRRTVFRVAWVPLALDGERIVSRTIRFLGRDFDVSTRVASELELEYGRIGFAWQFLSSDDGRFRVGPLIEAKGFRGTATLTAPDLPTPITESEEFETAFASAGLMVDLEPSERLHVFAEATMLVDDSYGDLFDAEIGVRFFPLDRLSIVGGFRQIEIDAEEGDDLLDLDIDGAFLGLSLHL